MKEGKGIEKSKAGGKKGEEDFVFFFYCFNVGGKVSGIFCSIVLRFGGRFLGFFILLF